MFLDEVDKIGAIPGIHQLRDVGGEGVQQVSENIQWCSTMGILHVKSICCSHIAQILNIVKTTET